MNIVINPMENGSCRTIKNQYQQSGPSNFQRQGTFGATGVINTEKIVYDDYNGNIAANQKLIGTITQQYGNSAIRHGNKIIEEKILTEGISKVDSLSRAEQSRAEQSRAEQSRAA